MSDRYCGFIVTLDKDIRDDAAKDTITAIKMIRGVVKVKPVVSDIANAMAESRVRHELTERLWKVLE